MTDPFNSYGAFDPLKEDVVVIQSRGARVIRSTARAVVVVGSSLSSAAGSQIATENADRYSVVIDIRDFEFSEEPAFGDSVDCESFGKLTVKQVTRGEHEYTLRCSRNMRGGTP